METNPTHTAVAMSTPAERTLYRLLGPLCRAYHCAAACPENARAARRELLAGNPGAAVRLARAAVLHYDAAPGLASRIYQATDRVAAATATHTR